MVQTRCEKGRGASVGWGGGGAAEVQLGVAMDSVVMEEEEEVVVVMAAVGGAVVVVVALW